MIDDRNEAKRGMLWLGSATAVTRLIDLGSSLVVLALLSREEMGTAALVLSTGAVVESASGMGIGYALIQAKNLGKSEEQSLFWLTTGIGVLLCWVLFAIAPWVAQAYALPVLLPMLLLTGAKFVLVGTAVVPQQLLSKHLMFRESGVAQTVATFSEAAAKIALALAGLGAWALVFANVFRGVALLSVVLLLSPFRPRLHFRWREVTGHMSFGARVAFSGFLSQGYRNADYFLVGKLLGVEALGIYRVAFDLGMQPLEVLINLVNRVSYPIYAKLAQDRVALKAALLRSIRWLLLLGAPMVVFFYFATEDLLKLITHGRWGAAVPAVQVLVWGALLRGVSHLFPQIYVAAGRPNYAVLDSAVTWVVLVSAFWAGLTLFPELGMLSVCWAWVLAYPGLVLMHLSLVRRILPLDGLEVLKALSPGFLGCVVMAASLWATIALGLHQYGSLISLLVWLAVGVGSYALYSRLVLKIRLGDLVLSKQVAQPI